MLAIGVALVVLVGAALAAGFRKGAPLTGCDRARFASTRRADALPTRSILPRLPAAERTPLMQLAIEDALDAVTTLDARHAVPLRMPSETLLVVLLAAGLALLSLFEVRSVRLLPPEPALAPLLMSPDDVALFRSVGGRARTHEP